MGGETAIPDEPTAALLVDLNAATPLHEMTPVQARTAFDETSTRYGTEPVEVDSVVDAVVPGPVGDIPVRIYSPVGPGPFPVVVYFPGGGFVVGSPDSIHGPATVWARDVGAVVVSVDYRKAPEAPFPAAFDDAVAVTRWVADHAAQWNGDPSRIVVAGDSSGGNLAAVVAIDARERGGGSGASGVVGQVLVYPATDITRKYDSVGEYGDGLFLTKDLLRWFGRHGAADPHDWRASPILVEDLSGVAPAFVVTAECDPIRDQGEAYADRLREAGVPVQAKRYDGQIHGFVANFAGALPVGRAAIDDISAFLRDRFSGAKSLG